MADHAQRFILEAANIRGELVHLNESYQEIMNQHQYPEHVRRILGEVIVASVLLASTIKFEGELTLQLQTEGVIQLLVAKCTNNLTIRGLAQWDDLASSEQFLQALGHGKLVITLQPKNSTQFYQSIVPINSHTIAAAIEFYFQQSEQLETRLWLAVDGQSAAGMLLQLLPGTHAEERQDFWQQVVIFADSVKQEELIACDNITLLDRLYRDEEVRIFAEKPVVFQCTCTLEKMERAIQIFGEVEANALLSTSPEIIVRCEFCNRAYSFDKIDVAQIFVKHKDRPLH